MKVFKNTYTKTVNGVPVTRKSSNWYGKMKQNGRWIKVPLLKDKKASEIKLAQLIRDSERKSVGATNPYEKHLSATLESHLNDWLEKLKHDNVKPRRIVEVRAQLVSMFDHLEAIYPEQVSTQRIISYLNQYQERRGVSGRTINVLLEVFKAFFNWMVRDGRLEASPAAAIKKRNQQTDIRHNRRMLSNEEIARLIKAARNSKRMFRGLSGVERANLYTTAIYTGLRAGELSKVRVDMVYGGSQPFVELSAAYTKNSKPVKQPLPRQAWVAVESQMVWKRSGELLWGGTWHKRPSQMIRKDLAEAGIERVVLIGGEKHYVDFHSLRHTFIGLLDQAGATLKEAMELARHSDPKLTMKVYGKQTYGHLHGVAERLPKIGGGT